MMQHAEADPAWWHEGIHDGKPLRGYLADRNIGALFRFLRNHGWSHGTIAQVTGVAENRVRTVVQGKQVITSYDVFARIADGLDIPRVLLGLGASEDPPRQAERILDPRRGPDFIESLAGLAVGAAPPNLAKLLPAPRPGEDTPAFVGPVQVQMVREIGDLHRCMDARSGGGSCRDSAVNYLSWAHRMLGSRFDSEQTEREMKAALSDLYQVAGWASHDLGDHAAARYYLTAALLLARQIGDDGLIAGGFYRLGRVAIHEGHAQEALKLWQLGQIVAQDSGNLASVAVLHANEAWAYAMLGSADRVSEALARAENELQRVDADTVPSWARFSLQPGELDGISGVVYTCLAAHPEHRTYASTAIARAERAFARRGPSEARSHAFDAISVATGYLLDGQLDQAEQYGHRAVDLATQTASARATDRLHMMADLARPHTTHSGLSDVRGRVAELAAS